jgi:hypothetical protein
LRKERERFDLPAGFPVGAGVVILVIAELGVRTLKTRSASQSDRHPNPLARETLIPVAGSRDGA